jgi:hypothetical protein
MRRCVIFHEMVDVLVERCGISRAEAVARINERCGRKEMDTLERNLMTHEFPEFWAYGAYFLPDDEDRLPTGDPVADADIDLTRLPVRPAPPQGLAVLDDRGASRGQQGLSRLGKR